MKQVDFILKCENFSCLLCFDRRKCVRDKSLCDECNRKHYEINRCHAINNSFSLTKRSLTWHFNSWNVIATWSSKSIVYILRMYAKIASIRRKRYDDDKESKMLFCVDEKLWITFSLRRIERYVVWDDWSSWTHDFDAFWLSSSRRERNLKRRRWCWEKDWRLLTLDWRRREWTWRKWSSRTLMRKRRMRRRKRMRMRIWEKRALRARKMKRRKKSKMRFHSSIQIIRIIRVAQSLSWTKIATRSLSSMRNK